jgi:hypothetical protein
MHDLVLHLPKSFAWLLDLNAYLDARRESASWLKP